MATSSWPLDRYPDAPRPATATAGAEFADYVCMTMARRYGFSISVFQSWRYQRDEGESVQGVEIKLDERCSDTGRLSIEVAERTRNDLSLAWTPSGILRDDNTWLYIQGNEKVFFVFPKNWLRRWYEEKSPPVSDKFGTIRTFYLDADLARRYAALVVEP